MEFLKKVVGDEIWKDEIWEKCCIDKYDFSLPLLFRNGLDILDKGIKIAKSPQSLLIYRIGDLVAEKDPKSHTDPFRHAIDFLVPDGTKICSIMDGIVIDTGLNSTEWGPTEDFADKQNYITIQHSVEHFEYPPDGLIFSQYCHVAKPTEELPQLVELGQYVKKGQHIGYVEKNGWTDRDHLHFMLFRNDSNPNNTFGWKSLGVKFET